MRFRLYFSIFLLVSTSILTNASPNQDNKQSFDPAAIKILQSMSDTYAHLPDLNQTSRYVSLSWPATGSGFPPPPPGIEAKKQKLETLLRVFHVEMAKPNLLHISILFPATDTGNLVLQQEFVSDGKYFWTYLKSKNVYTQDKVPVHLDDFVKLNSMEAPTPEVVMMLGVNPFQPITDSFQSAQLLDSARVDNVQTDVVQLYQKSSVHLTRITLFVGAEDHLLYRIVYESRPAPIERNPALVGDPLDALVKSGRGIPNNDLQVNITRLTCSNSFSPGVNREAFQFHIPQGALLSQPFQPGMSLHPDFNLSGLKLKPIQINRAHGSHGVRAPRFIKP